MKLLNRGLALAVVGAGLAALPTIGVQAAPAAQADPNGVAAMADRASGEVAVTREEATNKVGFIRVQGDGDLLPSVAGDSLGAAKDKADAYLDQYAANFGARPDELVRSGVAESAAGWTATYTQSYKGVDVFGSMLRVQVDREGDLTSVNGYAAPDLSLSVEPRISANDAGERAVGLVREDPPAHDGETADLTGIAPKTSELVVYRMGATRGEAGTAVLAYQVEVGNDDNIRDAVFIDAQTGKSLNRWSMVHDALDRELYEATGTRTAPVLTRVWKEGDPFPGTLNADQQQPGQLRRRVLLALQERLRSRLLRRRGRHDEDGQQRPADQLPQRQLERRRPPTTATASPPTTSSRTSGATPTPSTPPA